MTINRRSLIKLGLLGLGLLIIFLYNSSFREKNQLTVKSAISPDERTHQVIFYEDWKFFQAIKSVETESSYPSHEIKGGIIPHHLLANYMIADFFNKLSVQKPDTIILLGPNHEEKGSFMALTSQYKWQTPFGFVEPNRQIIGELTGRNVVRPDEEVLPQEHSVAGILPFIEHYLPESKVVPIIVSGKMTLEEAEVLSNSLVEVMNNKTVIISPVDFSHYLSAEQAASNDVLTWDLIQKFDYQSILRLGNGYFDSPPSLAVLMMIMQKADASKVELLRHANSADFFENQEGKGTTSYFTIEFHK